MTVVGRTKETTITTFLALVLRLRAWSRPSGAVLKVFVGGIWLHTDGDVAGGFFLLRGLVCIDKTQQQ